MTRIERIRAAAAAADLPTTQSRLRGFAREVARLRAAGALSSATAEALRTGAARAAARAQVEIPPPRIVAPAPAPAPKEKPKPAKHHGEHGKHGHGKEKGG
ncbi:MAG: hypothetical protein ACJ76Z_09470 [Thermoleophilaceae bacterium]